MSVSFSNAITFATGSLPNSVSIADLNGDGKADLAVANSGSNTVSVMLGNGDGSFRTQENDATGYKPVFVSIADVNNDGKKDLLVVTWNSGANPPTATGGLSILLGVGDGTFRPQIQNYASGSAPEALAINDFNHDGKLDVAITANMEGFISYGVGKGDGTFGFGMVLPAGSGPWGIASEDFNRDGNPDLVFANSNNNNVSVLLGNGNFGFSAQTYATGFAPIAVVTGDFNGDGKTDLAVADANNTNNVSILIGKGDGSFQAQTAYTVGIAPWSIAIADFNGDGKSDVLTAGNGSKYFSIMLGNGDGTFQTETLFNSGSNNSSVAVGDVNGDGKPDIITTNSASNTISVLLNSTKFPPIFTSASATTTSENISITTPIYNATAVTPGGTTPLIYSISGGADASSFSINGSSGAVTFKVSPNYEAPTDVGADNVYNIVLQATDGLLTATQAVAISVTNINEAPSIISGGAAIIPENIATTTSVYTATATDPDAGTTLVYSISGGADAALFNINATTGAVNFKVSPNFEAPIDAGANNVYDIVVEASDGLLTATQAVAITVTDVQESGTLSPPNIAWTKLTGTTGDDVVYALTTGPDGSIYVGGTVGGNFDGQPYYGDRDAFVTKYNPDGTRIWTKVTGLAGYDVCAALATSLDGTLYVSGTTNGNLDGQFNNGNSDVFVTKYNPDGAKIWTKLVGSSGWDSSGSLTTGIDGSVYVSGGVTGSLDGQAYNGGTDAFITKYSPDGTKVWTRLIGTSGYDVASATTRGLDGAIYVGGIAAGSLDGQTYNGGADAFVTKYNPDGAKIWTRLIGTSTGVDQCLALTTGLDGAIYIGGQASGGLDGQPFSGEVDAFVTKFSADGAKLWTRLIGSSRSDVVFSLTTGLDGSIFAAGYTAGNLDQLADYGLPDAFITKFTPDGTKVWTRLIGTSGGDGGYAVTTGLDGAVYMGGQAGGWLNGQAQIGATDGFIAKIVTNLPPTFVSSVSAVTLENVSTSASVYTAIATDPDTNTVLSYSIGGADAALFNINASTGAVTFKASPNFEAPSDAGANNVYDIVVEASDGLLTATQAVAITVTNVNEVPSITSFATSATPENISTLVAVYTATAVDPDASTVLTYSLSGGIDAARFNINPATGAVTFKLSPDFEAPTDSGANNVYDIVVRVSDGALYADKAVSITVTDVNEAPANASIHGSSYFWKANASGQHALLTGVNVTASGGAQSAEGANAPIQIKNIFRDAGGHVTADVFAHVISSMDAFDLNLDVGGGSNATFTSTLDATSWPVYWSASGSSVLASGFSMTAASAGDIKLGTLSFDAGASSAMHIAIKSGTDIALNNVATYAAPFSYVSAHGVTGPDGGYSISALDPGSYALTGSRSTNDIGNAISSSDALAALKLSVAMNPNATVNGAQAAVSPFQYMAADINGDGRITSSDALSILKMAVHLNGAATPEWMFVEETRDLSGIARTSAAWDHNISANVQGDTTVNLAGFIKGDVNGSWTPPAGTQFVETTDPDHFTNLNSIFHIPLSEWAIA